MFVAASKRTLWDTGPSWHWPTASMRWASAGARVSSSCRSATPNSPGCSKTRSAASAYLPHVCHPCSDPSSNHNSLCIMIEHLGTRLMTAAQLYFKSDEADKDTIWVAPNLCASCSSRTIMIATVSPSPAQYHHTVNTLKYADRAKELKTHVRRNTGTVQEHVTKLRQMISQLQKENAALKALHQPMVSSAAS